MSKIVFELMSNLFGTLCLLFEKKYTCNALDFIKLNDKTPTNICETIKLFTSFVS